LLDLWKNRWFDFFMLPTWEGVGKDGVEAK